jgi:hypothetical protein
MIAEFGLIRTLIVEQLVTGLFAKLYSVSPTLRQ